MAPMISVLVPLPLPLALFLLSIRLNLAADGAHSTNPIACGKNQFKTYCAYYSQTGFSHFLSCCGSPSGFVNSKTNIAK